MPLTIWDFVWSEIWQLFVQKESGLLYGHQILLPSMLVLLATFTLGCKYLLPSVKVNFWHCVGIISIAERDRRELSFSLGLPLVDFDHYGRCIWYANCYQRQNRIYHLSRNQTQLNGKRIMHETRFYRVFPASSVDLRVGISRSASENGDCFFSLPIIGKIIVFLTIFLLFTLSFWI